MNMRFRIWMFFDFCLFVFVLTMQREFFGGNIWLSPVPLVHSIPFDYNNKWYFGRKVKWRTFLLNNSTTLLRHVRQCDCLQFNFCVEIRFGEVSVLTVCFFAIIMNLLSKCFKHMLSTVNCTEIVHPHTNSCMQAAWTSFLKPVPTTAKFFLPLFLVTKSNQFQTVERILMTSN